MFAKINSLTQMSLLPKGSAVLVQEGVTKFAILEKTCESDNIWIEPHNPKKEHLCRHIYGYGTIYLLRIGPESE